MYFCRIKQYNEYFCETLHMPIQSRCVSSLGILWEVLVFIWILEIFVEGGRYIFCLCSKRQYGEGTQLVFRDLMKVP